MRRELFHLIDGLLPREGRHPELAGFYEMLREYPVRGGKGLRSALLLASAQAYSNDADTQQKADIQQKAELLGAALELFQNWVLVHDDIADDSEERRGLPALHRLHGMPLALNAGDALHAYMWELVLRAGVAGAPEHFLQMVHRTAEGQHLDLCWTAHNRWDLRESDYLSMVELKTAYYTVIAPLSLGALAAGQPPAPAFVPAGLALGAAFQIRDDVLNFAHSGDYGKERGGDLWEGKRTLIALAWLAEAGPHWKERFLAQMARPRTQKDPAEMAALIEEVAHSKATMHAQARAEALADEGLGLLRGALPQAGAADILGILESLARRSA